MPSARSSAVSPAVNTNANADDEYVDNTDKWFLALTLGAVLITSIIFVVYWFVVVVPAVNKVSYRVLG